MLAFARAQTDQRSDVEDLVQETFIGFLKSLDSYRGESKLESWLFRILRRRIIDHYRGRGSRKEISACALRHDGEEGVPADPIESLSDPKDSPSVYARREESREQDQVMLSRALQTVVDRLKEEWNLRDLMITEGLFYAGIRNKDLAQLIEMEEGQIAVIRHRILNRIRELIDSNETGEEATYADLLTEIWERDRPSCPKRTTLGKSLIGILNDDWERYVHFHVDVLGCRYCLANREDLQRDELSDEDERQSHRIFQSTIGFVSRAN